MVVLGSGRRKARKAVSLMLRGWGNLNHYCENRRSKGRTKGMGSCANMGKR
jgi:hypothetical protein